MRFCIALSETLIDLCLLFFHCMSKETLASLFSIFYLARYPYAFLDTADFQVIPQVLRSVRRHFANWSFRGFLMAEWESKERSVWHLRVIRTDLKIWNVPWIRICIFCRFPVAPASSLHGPRLSSFRRLWCKLQYSRAVRSDTKIYASPLIKIRYASYLSARRNKETPLRFSTRARAYPRRVRARLSITFHSLFHLSELSYVL